MKPRALILIAVLALSSLALFSSKRDQPDQPNSSHQTYLTASSRSRANTNEAPETEAPEAETPFWESAVVPDPGESVSVVTIRPEDLGINPQATTDPQALIAQAIQEKNLPAIHSAALTWFQQDPTAARDWLASQATHEDLQPAISSIAQQISENGHITSAIEWANILTDPVAREDTLFQIQASALLNRRINSSQIITDGLSPERIEELRSGGAGH